MMVCILHWVGRMVLWCHVMLKLLSMSYVMNSVTNMTSYANSRMQCTVKKLDGPLLFLPSH